MPNDRQIPIYRATMERQDDGMFCISLVDEPAVMKDFLKFNKQKQMRMMVADEDKRLVYGVVMRADYPIYRIDDEGYEYYIYYDAKVIRQMAEKYLKEGNQNNVSVDHDGKNIEGVDMVQWFIKDTEKGVAPKGFDDIRDGSLFAEFHVTDDELWKDIKDGKFNGFSLEGIFTVRQEYKRQDKEEISDEDYDEINSLIEKLKNKINKK